TLLHVNERVADLLQLECVGDPEERLRRADAEIGRYRHRAREGVHDFPDRLLREVDEDVAAQDHVGRGTWADRRRVHEIDLAPGHPARQLRIDSPATLNGLEIPLPEGQRQASEGPLAVDSGRGPREGGRAGVAGFYGDGFPP